MSESVDFKEYLLDKYSEVLASVDKKIWSIKQVAKFLRKRVEVFDEQVKNFEKLINRSGTIAPFEETTMNFALESLVSAMSADCLAQSNCSKKLLSDVVEPLDELVNELEQSRKSISMQGNAITRALNDSIRTLNKNKEKYHKTCREIEVTELQMKAIDTNSKKKTEYDKLEKKLNKLKEDCQEDEQAYRQELSLVNAAQAEFYTDSMPKVIGEVQDLLTKRSEELKRLLGVYLSACNEYKTELDNPSNAFSSAINVISISSDLTEFCQQHSTEPTVIPENFVFEPFVRVGKQDEKKGLFDKLRGKGIAALKEPRPVEKPAVSASNVFGLPLQVLVEREKDEHPGLGIPYLVFFAAETIIKLKGEYTLGVFRQSGALAKIKQICDMINLQDYDHFTFTPGSVHDMSSVLKQFLRQLPEPLFVPAVYDDCFGKPNVDQQEVINKLPEANQRLIKFIVRYLQRFAEPKTVERTQMTVSNLAAVFAPCLFRCPYTELNDLLRGSEQEKLFVEQMIKTLDTSDALEVKLVLNEAEVGYVKPNENILPTEKIIFDQAPLLPPPSLEKKALPPPPVKLPPPPCVQGSSGGFVPMASSPMSPSQRAMSPPPQASSIPSPGTTESMLKSPTIPLHRAMSPPAACSVSFSASREQAMPVPSVPTNRVLSPPPVGTTPLNVALDSRGASPSSPTYRAMSPPPALSSSTSPKVELKRVSPNVTVQRLHSPPPSTSSSSKNLVAEDAGNIHIAAEAAHQTPPDARPPSVEKEAVHQLPVPPPAMVSPKNVPSSGSYVPASKPSITLRCKLERPRSMLPPLPTQAVIHSVSQSQLNNPVGESSTSGMASDAPTAQEL